MRFRFIHAADIHLGYEQYNLTARANDFARAYLAMIDYAFRDLRLRRLVTGADPANVRARKLQARLGMRRERNLKADSPDTETEGVLYNDRI